MPEAVVPVTVKLPVPAAPETFNDAALTVPLDVINPVTVVLPRAAVLLTLKALPIDTEVPVIVVFVPVEPTIICEPFSLMSPAVICVLTVVLPTVIVDVLTLTFAPTFNAAALTVPPNVP